MMPYASLIAALVLLVESRVDHLEALATQSPPPPPELSDPLDDASNALDAGDAYFESQQFSLAIESYEEGIRRAERIPDPRSRVNALSKLRKRLIVAQLGAYDKDASPRRLLIAEKVLREQSAGTIDDPDTATLAQQISERRRANAGATKTQGEARAPRSSAGVLRSRRNDKAIWGAALTGVGAALALAFVGGAVTNVRAAKAHARAEFDTRTRRDLVGLVRLSLGLEVAAGVLAAAALTSGVTLLVVGHRMEPAGRAKVSVFPVLRSTGGGVGILARF